MDALGWYVYVTSDGSSSPRGASYFCYIYEGSQYRIQTNIHVQLTSNGNDYIHGVSKMAHMSSPLTLPNYNEFLTHFACTIFRLSSIRFVCNFLNHLILVTSRRSNYYDELTSLAYGVLETRRSV